MPDSIDYCSMIGFAIINILVGFDNKRVLGKVEIDVPFMKVLMLAHMRIDFEHTELIRDQFFD